jgi:alpha-beta hydrolase superfamily lysophospholipase
LENKGETEEEVENYSDAFHKILLEENTAIIEHYYKNINDILNFYKKQ